MNDVIARIVAGEYRDPERGKQISVPTKSVVISDDLSGQEAELVSSLGLEKRLAVVSDTNTEEALAARTKRSLKSAYNITPIILSEKTSADGPTVDYIIENAKTVDAIIAVGSGTINDLCKYAASLLHKPYAVFGTAPSMNGYASKNATIALNGIKQSCPASAPLGIFLDLKVLCRAPKGMIQAGLGDSICRPTAQADWLLSHLLFGTKYDPLPYNLLQADEDRLFSEPEALFKDDLYSMARLARTLVLSGFGMTLCGGSYPASQGEHLISHYIDIFSLAGGVESLHGQQIGVTSLTMSRLQTQVLDKKHIRVYPSAVDKKKLIAHYGGNLGTSFWREFSKKKINNKKAEIVNRKLENEWEDIQKQIQRITRSPEQIEKSLSRVKAPTTPEELGWSKSMYCKAVQHAREIRNRYTFLDFAADCGLLK